VVGMAGDLQDPMLAGDQIAGKSGRIFTKLEDFLRRAVKGALAGILQHVAGGDQNVDFVHDFGRWRGSAEHRIGDESLVVLVGLVGPCCVCAILGNSGKIAHTLHALPHGVDRTPLAL